MKHFAWLEPLHPAAAWLGRKWTLAFIIAVVTAAVFSSSIGARFVQWDDDINIYRNPRIQGFSGRNIEWMLSDSTYVRRYMPLSWLGFAAIHKVGGLNPAWFHAVNVTLHAVNAALLFLFLVKLLRLVAPRNAGETALPWCAAMGALLWSIHPLRVEVVAWASGMIYCEAFFFLLVAALSYVGFLERKRDGRPVTSLYWISVLAFGASLFSYPLAFGFLFVLPVLDFLVLGQWPWQGNLKNVLTRRMLAEKVPFLIGVSIVFAVTLWARAHAHAMWESPSNLTNVSIFSRVMQAFYIWAYYVWKPWLPLNLSPVYTTLVNFNPNGWVFLMSAVGVAAITFVLWGKRQQWGGLLALWFCYLVLLVPLLGLTESLHFPSDRYSYVAGFLWPVIVAVGLLKLWTEPRLRIIAALTSLMLLVVLGTLTMRQTRVWKDSTTLFQHMLAKLGNDPYRADIEWRLAYVLAEQRKTNEAIAYYRQSLQLLPDVAHVQQSIGSLLHQIGHHDEALEHLQKASRLGPDNVQLRQEMAAILNEQGKADQAAEQYWVALRLSPDNPAVLNELAWILATNPNDQVRNGREAVRLSSRACELFRTPVPAYITTLAAAYAAVGRFEEAANVAAYARDSARTAGLTNLVELNSRALEFYRAGKAYQEPLKTAGDKVPTK